MNENHSIQRVRRKLIAFLNKYLMLALLCSVGMASAQSQDGRITGKVISESDNQPLIGVSIKVKGTTVGTISDVNGNFGIQAKAGQTLTVSYIGYISQDVKVSGTTLSIRLTEDSKSLEEVVVIGYGTIKKKLNTGATVQVKGDDLLKQNTTSALQAMQGATPGVNITSTSGQPGKGANVTIRGLGSINGCNPLYLVDGVITGDISYLNNSDIASIDVLKDAASAAIYGSQASNGVVLVTTRTGSKGNAKLSFDGYYGVQNIAKKLQLLDAGQYATIMNEQAINSGNSPLYPTTGKAAFLAKYANNNWLDAIIAKDAPIYDYNTAINGGTDASVYSVSLGITGQDGVIGGHDVSSYQRMNFRANTEHNLYGKVLKVGEHLTFSYTNTTGVNEGNLYSGSPIRSALGTSPFLPMYDDSGNYLNNINNNTTKSYYNGKVWDPWEAGEANPYAAMNMGERHSTSQKLFGDVYAEVNPLKGLKFKTVFGLDFSTGSYRAFMPVYQLNMYTYNNNDYASQSLNQNVTWSWDNTLSYDFSINQHTFTALIGSSVRQYKGEWMSSRNANLVLPDYEHAWISNTTNTAESSLWSYTGGPSDESMLQSYFGRLIYNYKEKYMVNATFRADGSSRFAPGHRWGYFPSVSAGWVLTNEDFMADKAGTIDFLKVRLSWGQNGNQNIPAWKYLPQIQTSNAYYYFGDGMTAGTLTPGGAAINVAGSYPAIGNNLLRWETSEQTNIGVDAKFLNSRLGVNLDLYDKTSKGWLIEAPIRVEAGAETSFMNGGDVTNRGVELALTWNDKIGKDINYYVNGNVAYNNNHVNNVPTADGIIHGTGNEAYNNADPVYRKAQTGYPIGYFWGFKTDGILQNQTEVNSYIASLGGNSSNTLQGRNIAPGDVRYVDVDKNGVINEADKTMIGNPNPDFTFGLSLGFTWKALDFSLTSNGVAGNEIFQSYRNYGSKTANYTTAILGRWHGEGTSNELPRLTETNINYRISDIFIHKGDFLRISNIQVGYDFAKNIKWKYLSQFRLYVAVQNAFTLTSYDGMDPEIGYGTDASTSGVDLGYYPRPRTILTGINIKF